MLFNELVQQIDRTSQTSKTFERVFHHSLSIYNPQKYTLTAPASQISHGGMYARYKDSSLVTKLVVTGVLYEWNDLIVFVNQQNDFTLDDNKKLLHSRSDDVVVKDDKIKHEIYIDDRLHHVITYRIKSKTNILIRVRDAVSTFVSDLLFERPFHIPYCCPEKTVSVNHQAFKAIENLTGLENIGQDLAFEIAKDAFPGVYIFTPQFLIDKCIIRKNTTNPS